jgi:dipeptide/tripeptide permease
MMGIGRAVDTEHCFGMNVRVIRTVMFVLAAVILVAGVWWAIVMPQHYTVAPEGPPIHEDDTGTRIALAMLSVVLTAALVTLAYALNGRNGKRPLRGAHREESSS